MALIQEFMARYDNDILDFASDYSYACEKPVFVFCNKYELETATTIEMYDNLESEGYELMAIYENGKQIFAIIENDHHSPEEYCDEEIEELWGEFIKTSISPHGLQITRRHGKAYLTLTNSWHIFNAGTPTKEILEWFDSEYSDGLNALRGKCPL